MGYCVNWKGSFKTDKPLTAEHAAELRGYEGSEEWPGDVPDRRFNPWDVTGDNAGFEVRTDKPGDWKSWLQYTIDHFLTPWGYTLSGSVEWDGEERGDAGVITIEDGRVKARRTPVTPWASISKTMRDHVGERITEAMHSDRYRGTEDAWNAALTLLGRGATSDRAVFDD